MQVWRLAFSFHIAASHAEQLRKPRYPEQGFLLVICFQFLYAQNIEIYFLFSSEQSLIICVVLIQ